MRIHHHHLAFISTICFALACHESSCQEYDYNKIYSNDQNGTNGEPPEAKPEKRPFLQLNINSAVPIGSYGSNVFSDYPEFSKTGIDINLNFFKPLYGFIHVFVSAGFAKNGSRMDEIVDLNNSSPTSSTTVTNFNFNGYRHGYLATGFMLTGQLDWIAFDLKAGFGFGLGFRSPFEIEETDRSTLDQYVTRWDSADDFAILLPSVGVAARMFPTKKFFLSINLDYKRAQYDFENIGISVTSGGFTQGYIHSLAVNMHLLSVGVGAGVMF